MQAGWSTIFSKRLMIILISKGSTWLERTAGDKRSSLLGHVVIGEEKRFSDVATWSVRRRVDARFVLTDGAGRLVQVDWGGGAAHLEVIWILNIIWQHCLALTTLDIYALSAVSVFQP